jgi:hypothetical protein
MDWPGALELCAASVCAKALAVPQSRTPIESNARPSS